MNVNIQCQDSQWRTVIPDIITILDVYAHKLRLPSCEVNVILTDDQVMRDINYQWRGKNQATDVLSFPSSFESLTVFEKEQKQGFAFPYYLLGDIVISYDFVFNEACVLQVPFTRHIYRLLAHGLLHLLGYDHEIDSDAALMEEKEKFLCGAQ